MSRQVGLEYAFRRLHSGENDLAEHLISVGDRHETEHEVHHVATDLAAWSRDNVAALAQVADEHGIRLDAEAEEPNRFTQALGKAVAVVSGRRPEPGILLLEDLRDVYLMASHNSLAWEMLAQHAQAKRETDILELTANCHPKTLRQIRWANTMLKTLSPQVLASL